MPLEPKENTLKCKHLNAGLCSLVHFDMTPSTKDCLGCSDYDGTSRGWGDDFKKIMNVTGIDLAYTKVRRYFKLDEGCGGCQKRQKKWNETFPHESEEDA